MFTTFFSLTFLVLFRIVFAQLLIDTPHQLVQCQQTQLTWVGSSYPPYDISVVSAADMCGDPIESIRNLTGNSTTWTTNIAAGTQVVFVLYDANNNDAWSAIMTVGNSSDTSCLTNTTSSAAGSAVPSASPSSPAGSANAGVSSTSGTLSTRAVSAVTLLGTGVLAVVAFAL